MLTHERKRTVRNGRNRMLKKNLLIITITTLIAFVQGCRHDYLVDPAPSEVSFASDIQPIFNSYCVGCHVAEGAAGSYLILTPASSYSNLLNQSSKQNSFWKLVVPFKPDSSLLYLKISTSNPPVGNRMPSGESDLTASTINTIRTWISNGAKNN